KSDILTAYNLPYPDVNPDIALGNSKLRPWVKDLETKATQFTVKIDSSSNGNGSGVIIAKSGKVYTVLTADHVICEKPEGAISSTPCINYSYKITTHDGKIYSLNKNTFIRQEGVDLAVFQFESDDNYPVAQIADYGTNEADYVFVAGFPKVGNENPKWMFNGGFISNLFQTRQSDFNKSESGSLSRASSSLTGGYELVYTSITYGGMSGGAVLDSQGRLIGIHGRSEGVKGYIQLGFSLGIPINTFLGLKDKFKINPQILTNSPQLNNSQKKDLYNVIVNVEVPKTNAKADIWIERGNQLWRLSKYDEAIKAFEEAIKQNDPNYVYLGWYGKGLALFYLKKDEESIKAFDQAIITLPKGEDLQEFHGSILYWQSALYRFLEDYEKGLMTINKAIAISPNNPNLYNEKWSILYRTL
ncbi:MAG TPA: tetratricopeptide repeat-containing serine protease family protein, partial [Allocoleopsis sp.]